jgi:hypothetical protein
MAFVDTAIDRRIFDGVLPVQVTLAGSVHCGDPLMYNSGWQLATNTSGHPAILIAGESGATGDVIKAYGIALVESTHTATNVPTMGEQIAVADTGIYAPDAANTQDIGYIVEIDSTNTHSKMLLCPAFNAELDATGV